MSMKICSFNVHMMYLNTYFNEIIKKIQQQDLDIVCLQEISENAVIKMAKLLNMRYVYGFFNAILTKHNILDYSEIDIGDKRGALNVNIQTSDQHQIRIIVTHIDHRSEKKRTAQLSKLSSILSQADILVGDMNSINMADYDQTQFEKINKSRYNAFQEPIKSDVIEFIYSNDFVTNEFIGPTCPYGTRVDYIFYKPTKYICKDNSIINCIDDRISDHNMVVMDVMSI